MVWVQINCYKIFTCLHPVKMVTCFFFFSFQQQVIFIQLLHVSLLSPHRRGNTYMEIPYFFGGKNFIFVEDFRTGACIEKRGNLLIKVTDVACVMLLSYRRLHASRNFWHYKKRIKKHVEWKDNAERKKTKRIYIHI